MVNFQSLDGVDSIDLPNPEQGNSRVVEFTRINRRSRGGDLIVYSDARWPKNKKESLTFILTKLEKAEELLKFMEKYLGVLVQFTNYRDRVYRGFIMTPNSPATQENRYSKTISLEFLEE